MMYLVVIESGDYEYYRETPLFVTNDEYLASKYVEKFNRVIGKLRGFYSARADEYFSCDDGTKEWMEFFVDKYYNLMDEPIAKYIKIKIR